MRNVVDSQYTTNKYSCILTIYTHITLILLFITVVKTARHRPTGFLPALVQSSRWIWHLVCTRSILILSSHLGLNWKFPDQYSIGLCSLSSLVHVQAFYFFILNNLKMCKIWLTSYKLYSVCSEEDSSRILRNVATLATLHGVLTQNITIFIFTTVHYTPTQDATVSKNRILL